MQAGKPARLYTISITTPCTNTTQLMLRQLVTQGLLKSAAPVQSAPAQQCSTIKQAGNMQTAGQGVGIQRTARDLRPQVALQTSISLCWWLAARVFLSFCTAIHWELG